jgi:hypothetical protein
MLILGIILFIVAILLMISIGVECTEYKSDLVKAHAIIGALIFIFFLGSMLCLQEHFDPSISPMDVYRGKTTLEITYRDSIAIDSIVVWKEEIK